ncbi:hypothetical protein PoB_005028000 [Plakobranchus ocellatus]|uniref:Uncharacterized protein n=1 Tax=Plakobranchus ocellatus TaxID=259542 RepID=A0AAV4BXA2_9GAST|nr:hypothetical protein PoB_005028000 [Plakobranchus ocellatus]
MYRREAVQGRHPVLVASYDTHSTVDRFYPRLHMGRERSRGQQKESRRDDSAGKEVEIEDKSQVEKEMSPCPDERQSIGDNLPWSPLTTRGNHGGAHFFPGPYTGKLTETHH